jgi:peptide/nickel transport system substrate-binding protein
MKKMRRLAAVSITAALTMAACGSDGSSDDESAVTEASTEQDEADAESVDATDPPADSTATEDTEDEAAGDTDAEAAEDTTATEDTDDEAAATTAVADDESAAEVQDGGESTVIQFTDAQSLDPTIIINSPTQGSTIMNALYDVLFLIGPDGEIEPRIATDFSTEDGLTWTMTLRDDVVFSDGTPFNAQAVADQWLRIKDNIRSSGWSILQNATSITAVDDTTFEITFDQPNRQFHQAVIWSDLVWIPSATAYAAEGENFGNAPVGAGPFLLENRTPSAQTTFVRNPDYWQEGLPKLDSLTVLTIPDPQQGYDTLTTGGADAYMSMPQRFALQAQDAGLTALPYDQIGGSGWLFGTKRPPFDNPTAREAVWLAMDMDELNEVVGGGVSDVPETLIQESSPMYDASTVFPDADPARAQELLDQLAAEGTPVSFTIATTEGAASQRAVAIQTQLAQFDNLDVQVEVIPGPEYGTTLFTGDFDLAIYGFGGIDPEPAFASFRSDAPLPIAAMNNAEIDAAIQAGREATTVEERTAAYADLAAAFNDEYRMRFENRNYNWVVLNEDVGGTVQYGQGSVLLDGYGQVG